MAVTQPWWRSVGVAWRAGTHMHDETGVLQEECFFDALHGSINAEGGPPMRHCSGGENTECAATVGKCRSVFFFGAW